MYLDTMQQIFSSTSKVMVDSKNGNNLLNLPLDKLIAQAAAGDAARNSNNSNSAGSPATAPTTATLPADVMPSVEVSRQREPRPRDSSRERESR